MRFYEVFFWQPLRRAVRPRGEGGGGDMDGTRRGHTIWKNKQRESLAEVDSCSTIPPKKNKSKKSK